MCRHLCRRKEAWTRHSERGAGPRAGLGMAAALAGLMACLRRLKTDSARDQLESQKLLWSMIVPDQHRECSAEDQDASSTTPSSSLHLGLSRALADMHACIPLAAIAAITFSIRPLPPHDR